ncbi:hypothetical protein NQ317_007791 [Molorchus minor]|uniref:Aminopeptidase n=1 Tax=Molorchus minor TaxID=1323400 RepID=A0ABQ9IXJ1_9CUCU|nr:hypothetical protein NQ317_007791 [Molorchus minor]
MLYLEHYKLEIISYLGVKDNFDFDGKVWIQTTCLHPTQNITLHSKDLEIKENEITVKDISSTDPKSVKTAKIEFDKDKDFLIISLEKPLAEDHKYEIFIQFKGKLDDGLAGFYRSSYSDKKNGEKRWLGVTQFEAISARRAFPCFDEPEMKATFDISIGRKDGYHAISNMPLLQTEPLLGAGKNSLHLDLLMGPLCTRIPLGTSARYAHLLGKGREMKSLHPPGITGIRGLLRSQSAEDAYLGDNDLKEKDGWFWDRFDSSVPMSTYLVAYVVSDFDHKTGVPIENNNVTFRIWARKDALNQVDFASEVGPKALEYFEKFFDIKYPLPKQDMVAIPDFSAGAMENWGLITYREAYLLYDPDVSSKMSQHGVASVIAHELAHQWFGNLVTMKWWTDLWLNEGFATYMASVAVEALFPQWNSLEEEAASNLLSVFSFDSLRTSHPVSVPIGDPKEIEEIFDTISYKKGSSLIRMMSLFLGEEVVHDLWESLTTEAHKDKILPANLTVKTIMDTWTLQTGYPVITVTRNYRKKSAEVKQRRFLRDIVHFKDNDNSCWWVPLSYSTKQHPDFNKTIPEHWLSCPDHKQDIVDIADEKDWVIFNNNMAGIYKINYDDDNWKMITKTLQSGDYHMIPTLNRVQLLSDAADLAFVGTLKYDVFFDMMEYLKSESEYLPWKTALGKTSGLTMHLKKSSIYGVYKDYMKKILTPIYEKVGGLAIPKSNTDKLDSIKLQVLVASKACKFEVANCIAHSQSLFKQFQENPNATNPISKDLRGVVYCTSLKHGGEAEWDFLWKRFQSSNVATEKNTMLNALGCSREVWILSRYLDWSLDDGKIRRQDSSTVFSSVARNDVGYYIAKNFFYDNVKKIFKHLLPNKRRISRYLASMSSQMTDEKEQEEFKQFIEKNKENFSDVKKGVEQSLETVKINIQWQNTHEAAISKILRKYSTV